VYGLRCGEAKHANIKNKFLKIKNIYYFNVFSSEKNILKNN
jgi:hypothetical protein